MRKSNLPARVLTLSLILVSLAFTAVSSRAQDNAQEDQFNATVYYLNNVSSDDAYRMIFELMRDEVQGKGAGGNQFRVVPNQRTNSLVVVGTEEQHENIKALLSLLDKKQTEEKAATKARNVQVEIFWIADLHDSEGSIYNDQLSDVPAEMADLVQNKLAERLNLENPRLVTKLMVQTMVSPQAGRIKAERVGRSGEGSLMLSAAGSVSANDQSNEYAMSLNLQVSTAESASNVEATFLIKPDKPMCLAVAETGPLKSVFIVRIHQDDSE